MIGSIDITGLKYEVNDATRRYVLKKIGSLDRYMPSHARKSVSVRVILKEVNRDHGNKYEAEVVVTLPDKTMTATDSTLNMMAAIDIVAAKLVTQLRKYKQATLPHVGRRKLLARFKRRPSATV
jgi:putative sigma-54 modulation protein